MFDVLGLDLNDIHPKKRRLYRLFPETVHRRFFVTACEPVGLG